MPIETIIFFVSWLALAVLGAGLLLYGWKWLLVSGWGWLLAMVIEVVLLARAGDLQRRSVDPRSVVARAGNLWWRPVGPLVGRVRQPGSDLPKVL